LNFTAASSRCSRRNPPLTLDRGGGDFSNVRENDVFGPIYNDHIRAVTLTSDYRLQDNFGGNNYLTLAYRQGLDILGASHRDDDFLSRDGASGKFSALNFWFHAATRRCPMRGR